jgi:hypothetical protein
MCASSLRGLSSLRTIAAAHDPAIEASKIDTSTDSMIRARPPISTVQGGEWEDFFTLPWRGTGRAGGSAGAILEHRREGLDQRFLV